MSILAEYEEENERFADTIRALRRQVRTLTAERDEARAEVVRLGQALQKAADDQCGCLGTVVPR